MAGSCLLALYSVGASVGQPPHAGTGGTVPHSRLAQTQAPKGSPQQSAPATNTPPPAGPLRLLVGPGLTLVTSRDARYDFGAVTLFDTSRVEHTFTLQNDTHNPVKLRQLQPSCGCTSVFVGAQSASDASLPTLQPGQQLSVRALIDLSKLGVGPLHKYVWVYVAEVAQPVAMLELQGALLPSAVFAPSVVDFGSVPAGTGKSATVTLHYDPRIQKNGKLPPISCSNAAVEVLPLSSGSGTSTALPPSVVSTALKRTQAFRVTLKKDAPLGTIHGAIAFLPAISGDPRSPEYQAALRKLPSPLRNVLVGVDGQVVGDLSAQPPELTIGVQDPDQGHTQKLTLQGKNRAVFQNLKATCASPWLSARSGAAPSTIASSGIGSSEVTQDWEITVHPGLAPGMQRSLITFTLANGQRLNVPVVVYVFRKGNRG